MSTEHKHEWKMVISNKEHIFKTPSFKNNVDTIYYECHCGATSTAVEIILIETTGNIGHTIQLYLEK